MQVRGVFRTQPNIYEEAFLQKPGAVESHCFCKKAPSQMFDWALNAPLQVNEKKFKATGGGEEQDDGREDNVITKNIFLSFYFLQYI